MMMASHQRHSGRRKGRLHDGKVVVMRSNLRWCSDVFQNTCWNGDIVRIVFFIDAHDREGRPVKRRQHQTLTISNLRAGDLCALRDGYCIRRAAIMGLRSLSRTLPQQRA
jgi:hypothetical protein